MDFQEEKDVLKVELKLTELYYDIFNRPPDEQGLKFWKEKILSKTITLPEIIKIFQNSPESSKMNIK